MKRRICWFLYQRLLGSHLVLTERARARLLQGMIGKRCDGLLVRAGVIITGYRHLTLGSNVSLNHNCFLSCDGGLTIGNDVSIGHSVSILTTEHGFSDPDVPIKFQPLTLKPVHIGDNVWIGAKATILAGVTLASGTIVAAGAVVAKSVTDPDSIVAGVPARRIKGRFDTSGTHG